MRLWPAAASLGFLFALFGGSTATFFYLYKVLGASWVWSLPLIVLMIPLVFVAGVIFASSTFIQNSNGTKVELAVTSTWWLVGVCLAVLLVVTVTAAIVNGERWMRRNRFNLPRNQFEAFIRSRGTLAWLWLPR
jgi:NADH:ubiquinone oxidoreductase subunit 5 (subunit L)/multisubunit Na+/H+ antiporter MnhA subunit